MSDWISAFDGYCTCERPVPAYVPDEHRHQTQVGLEHDFYCEFCGHWIEPGKVDPSWPKESREQF